jgi:thiamine pyrophosphokinase
MLDFCDRTVILANGEVPRHAVPLTALKGARRVICCDGAADKLMRMGRDPEWVVGDMDSISGAARDCYRDRTVADTDQSRNDLTKAFKLCLKHGWREIAVVGAAGGREDHTLGNLSLLVDFARQLDIVMPTDSGVFLPLTDRGVIACEPGQQVSVFSFDPETAVTSQGLRYPLNGLKISRWWQAALNEALAGHFSLEFDGGPLLVFLAYNH